MLVIRRRVGESVLIGEGVEITVIDVTASRVKLGGWRRVRNRARLYRGRPARNGRGRGPKSGRDARGTRTLLWLIGVWTQQLVVNKGGMGACH